MEASGPCCGWEKYSYLPHFSIMVRLHIIICMHKCPVSINIACLCVQIKCVLKLYTYRQSRPQPNTSLRSCGTYSSLPFTTEALKLISRCCLQLQARRKSHNWHVGNSTIQSDQMKNLTVAGESSFGLNGEE